MIFCQVHHKLLQDQWKRIIYNMIIYQYKINLQTELFLPLRTTHCSSEVVWKLGLRLINKPFSGINYFWSPEIYLYVRVNVCEHLVQYNWSVPLVLRSKSEVIWNPKNVRVKHSSLQRNIKSTWLCDKCTNMKL